MKKIQERIYKVVNDVIKIPSELNAIAKENDDEGYLVERDIAGTVIIKLVDGEIHYVPAGQKIMLIAFIDETHKEQIVH